MILPPGSRSKAALGVVLAVSLIPASLPGAEPPSATPAASAVSSARPVSAAASAAPPASALSAGSASAAPATSLRLPVPQASSAAPIPAALPPLPPITDPFVLPFAGAVVLALDGATDLAWPLARAVYADPALRPAHLDDAAARALAGEKPSLGATGRAKELAELRGAVHGDDGPSRRLLQSLGQELGVSVLLVVTPPGPHGPACLVFPVASGVFEPVPLPPDPGTPVSSWRWALGQLKARVPAAPPAKPAGASTPFYKSFWFWGAIGVAAAFGTTVFLLSRDTGASSVHLTGSVVQPGAP